MSNSKPKPFRLQVEQDYRIFFVFLAVILVIVSVATLVSNPALQNFRLGALFSVLMVIHIFLHLVTIRHVETSAHKAFYILGQGLLAFVIVQLSASVVMIYPLYMALIGEAIGLVGLNRWSLFSVLYYLALCLGCFLTFTNPLSTLYWFSGSIPIIIFITLYVFLYTRQIEAREKAQELAAELEAANRQLSEYAARIEDLTITAERERLARELHDLLSQGLAGLTLQLEAADAHLVQRHPEQARAIIAQAMHKARESLADARRVIGDLRENQWGELREALRREIDRFQSATAIPCAFHADPTAHLPDTVKETVLRTVSEALTNIARHARASEAAVTLTVKEQTLIVTIQDNGIGFEPEGIPPGHYGLLGIGERIRLIGGTLTLDTAPQQGTIITMTLPCCHQP